MSDEKPFCAFCKRSKDDVNYLVAGPGAAICEECVSHLIAIVAEESPDWRDAQIERLSKTGN
jgi:ATP-dependent Clp protease ATP-binding subunit ClpX